MDNVEIELSYIMLFIEKGKVFFYGMIRFYLFWFEWRDFWDLFLVRNIFVF